MLGPCTAYPHHFTIQQKRYVKPFKPKNTVFLQVQQHLHSIGALVHDIDFGDDTNGSAGRSTRQERRQQPIKILGRTNHCRKFQCIYIYVYMYIYSNHAPNLIFKKNFRIRKTLFLQFLEFHLFGGTSLPGDIHHGFMRKSWPVFCT